MKSNPLSNWPPIIRSHHIPLWVRIRDVLLTVGAWFVIFITLHNLLWLVFDYLSDPIFELSTQKPFNWLQLWDKVSLFVYVALGLVAWICFLAISRRKIINSTKYIKTFPPSVEMKELEVELGVLPEDVEHWHELRSVQVFVNDDNRVCKITPSQKN
jgi:poly-beta-1,6-N-acetyl-D-glucosamine biosynthesis protein PgaD